jgi:hypothetical protein
MQRGRRQKIDNNSSRNAPRKRELGLNLDSTWA